MGNQVTGFCSFVHNGSFHVYCSVKLESLDINTGVWSSADTSLTIPHGESASCCTVIGNKLYLFGGWCIGNIRNADMSELNLDTLEWRKLEAKNPEIGPIRKDKAGMFTYGDEMIGVFGGYGYPDSELSLRGRRAKYDPNPDPKEVGKRWTNELHLFHVKQNEWIVPVTSGPPPPPCAAFSLTRVDSYRLVLFGGKQLQLRVNDVHILDLDTWHWSGVQLPSRPEDPWPLGRSFHTACTLVDPSIITPPHAPSGLTFDWLPCPTPDLNLSPSKPNAAVDPKILVLWGMDNEADPINDAWELNVNSLSWKKVNLPHEAGPARIWHTSSVYHPSPCEAVVVSHGGTIENLVKRDPLKKEEPLPKIMFYCGVRSLLQLCLDLITEDGTLLSLTHKLPRHLQQQIKDQITNTQRANINRLCL